MILIAYDGSDDAKEAIEQAGELFKGESATVVTVWQRFIDTMARIGGGVGAIVDYEEIDTASEQSAAASADQGAELASGAGLLHAVGKSLVVESTIAAAILHAASEVDADAVVLGSRGYTGVKSMMLGSVSSHVLHHADRPVLVVPSPTAAAERATELAGK